MLAAASDSAFDREYFRNFLNSPDQEVLLDAIYSVKQVYEVLLLVSNL